MNRITKTIRTLTAMLAMIALTACQPDAVMEQEQGAIAIDRITVSVQQMQSMASTRTIASGDYSQGQPKMGFALDDVLHIAVALTYEDKKSGKHQIYTAKCTAINPDGTATTLQLDRTMTLPQNAIETYNIEAFYNGTTTMYADYTAFEEAKTESMSGTDIGTTGQKKFIDLLTAEGFSNVSYWNNADGISLTPDGKLTFKMRHEHSLISIASITNNLGSLVTGIMANLSNSDGTSLPSVPLPLLDDGTATSGTTPTPSAAWAMAGRGHYLKTFTITLEGGKALTIPAPDRPSYGPTIPGSGTFLSPGHSYTYRLHLNPGSLTATIVDPATNPGLEWEDKDLSKVPDGYTAIYDRKGLEAIDDNAENLGKSYILMADIDLTPSTPDGNGSTNGLWTPIGIYNDYSDATAFTGIFNGNGHIIKGMTINNSGGSNQGLFGAIGGNAILYNIHLRDVNVTGNNFVGALVGRAGRAYGSITTISGCSSTGTVSGNGYLGGLVGDNSYAHITRCWSTATVSGKSIMIGGLVGGNSYGSIVASYTQGSKVSSSDSNVGGLVGYYSDSQIFGCYAAQSMMQGSSYVGVLIAWDYSNNTTTSCYATNASGSDNPLVGHHEGGNNTTFSACISPRDFDSGNSEGGIDGITTSTNYAPLSASGNELSITDIRTVIPVAGNLGAITTATRTWTNTGIWGTIADGSKIPPHIIWTYNGELAP